jgi:hypothetical protein
MAPIEGDYSIGTQSPRPFRVENGESQCIHAVDRAYHIEESQGSNYGTVGSLPTSKEPVTVRRYDSRGELITTITAHKGGWIIQELTTGKSIEIKSRSFKLKAKRVEK